MGEGNQNVQTSSSKINKSQECNVQRGDYSEYCNAYLKVSKRVDLKSYHHKGKIGTIYGDEF